MSAHAGARQRGWRVHAGHRADAQQVRRPGVARRRRRAARADPRAEVRQAPRGQARRGHADQRRRRRVGLPRQRGGRARRQGHGGLRRVLRVHARRAAPARVRGLLAQLPEHADHAGRRGRARDRRRRRRGRRPGGARPRVRRRAARRGPAAARGGRAEAGAAERRAPGAPPARLPRCPAQGCAEGLVNCPWSLRSVRSVGGTQHRSCLLPVCDRSSGGAPDGRALARRPWAHASTARWPHGSPAAQSWTSPLRCTPACTASWTARCRPSPGRRGASRTRARRAGERGVWGQGIL